MASTAMIEKLELLLHLARERHFGKAAQTAGISQPTLSSAVKSLEEQLGIVIVERGSRFRGFTPEGERLLRWARQLTGDVRAMHQEFEAIRSNLAGELRLGVIPTATLAVTELTVPFQTAFKDVRFRISSITSDQILQRLEDIDIDIGISYLEAEPLGRFRGIALYEERYALLVPPDSDFKDRSSMTWHDAGQLPLCQLSPDMQNRRLIDRHLREAGAEPKCTVESNSMLILYAHVRTGAWASIFPVRFAEDFQRLGRLQAIPLVEPDVRHVVGLILPDRDTHTPMVSKFIEIARKAFPWRQRVGLPPAP